MKRHTVIGRLSKIIVPICLIFIISPAFGADLLSQGLAAQKAGKNEEAVKLLEQYLKDHPDATAARRARSQVLNDLGRKTEALEEINRGLTAHPDNKDLLLTQGTILAGLERRGEAIAAFSKILTLDPKNVEALKERGDNLAQEGSFDEALKDLDQAADLAPQDPWVLQKRGMVKFCLGEYPAAVADLSAAIKLAPDLGLFYFCRGQIYLQHLHQKDKAAADFQAGCRLESPLCCRELEKMGLTPLIKP